VPGYCTGTGLECGDMGNRADKAWHEGEPIRKSEEPKAPRLASNEDGTEAVAKRAHCTTATNPHRAKR
jgi:hypothetical protein